MSNLSETMKRIRKEAGKITFMKRETSRWSGIPGVIQVQDSDHTLHSAVPVYQCNKKHGKNFKCKLTGYNVGYLGFYKKREIQGLK